jgi:glycosyltransferase involved in cell wall biosynthesis
MINSSAKSPRTQSSTSISTHGLEVGGRETPKPVSVSVVLPAHNEEQNVRHAVDSARMVLSQIATDWEIIVVDDGSTDGTSAVCEELIVQCDKVRIIRHTSNKGYGAALKSGILAARHELIFFTDADGQFDLRELERLVEWSDEYDIVMGYRGKRRDPWHRVVNAFGWNVLIRLVFGVRVRDIDCAFKLFRRAVFDQIQIRSAGAMINAEILAQATRFGMRMREIKVTHYPRSYGKASGANIAVIMKAFRELLRVSRQLRSMPDGQVGEREGRRQNRSTRSTELSHQFRSVELSEPNATLLDS